ncbi:hypothetical protein ABK040_000116 [Willaertia magna]
MITYGHALGDNELIIHSLFEFNRWVANSFPSVHSSLEETKSETFNCLNDDFKHINEPSPFYTCKFKRENFLNNNFPVLLKNVKKQSEKTYVYLFLPDCDTKNSKKRLEKYNFIYEMFPYSHVCEINYGMSLNIDKNQFGLLDCTNDYYVTTKNLMKNEMNYNGVSIGDIIYAENKDFIYKKIETKKELGEISDTLLDGFCNINASEEEKQIYSDCSLDVFHKNCEWVIVKSKKDDQVIACAQLIKGEYCAAIFSLAVRTKYQRKFGIGKCLMVMMIDLAIANGYNKIVMQSTKLGRPLYEKLGFEYNFDFQIVSICQNDSEIFWKCVFGLNDEDWNENYLTKSNILKVTGIGVGIASIVGVIGYSLWKKLQQ